MPLDVRGLSERIGVVASPREDFLGTDPNADSTGEVTEEARTQGWTVQRPLPRRHLPVATTYCVACWQSFDPNDTKRHDCLPLRAVERSE